MQLFPVIQQKKWGNPFVAREYNTQSFINCHDYKNFDDVIDVIKSIDHDDALWCKIMSQPKQSPEQIADSQASQDEVTQFLDNIFYLKENWSSVRQGAHGPSGTKTGLSTYLFMKKGCITFYVKSNGKL